MVEAPSFALNIPAFAEGAMIPAKYTCDLPRVDVGKAGGEHASPAIEISGVPDGTLSLALIMDDPDIPEVFKKDRGISEFVHWVLFNMPATTTEIPEGSSVGVVGANGAGKNAYHPPCPPPQYEPSTHRYIFKLYALDATLPLQAGASAAEVQQAMEGHIIAQTAYTGLYKRQ